MRGVSPRPATGMQAMKHAKSMPVISARVMLMALALLCLLAAAADVGAEEITCAACGSTIHGEHLVYEGNTYCSQHCLDSVLPTCATCGRTIRDRHLTLNGKHYCDQSCLAPSLPVCDMCGQSVQGNYFQSNGKTYCCEACYHRSLPRCAACGQLMSAWLEIEGKRYCHTCANDRRCDACGHPGPSIGLRDGRRICTECWKTAVVEQQDGEQLFRMVRRKMGRALDLATEHEITFHLVSRDDLERISNGSASGKELGYFQYQAETTTTYFTTRDRNGNEQKRVAGERTDEKYHIYVLYGLPEKRLMEVVAHELAHDWMRANLPRIKAPIFEEGFAEYVAWLVNDSFGHHNLKRRIEENEDPVYGDGFKMMKGLADRHGGLDGLVEYLEALP